MSSDGMRVIVGAHEHDGEGGTNSGSARIFQIVPLTESPVVSPSELPSGSLADSPPVSPFELQPSDSPVMSSIELQNQQPTQFSSPVPQFSSAAADWWEASHVRLWVIYCLIAGY